MKRKLLYLLFFVSFFQIVASQNVSLDTSFGSGGVVINSVSEYYDTIFDFEFQSNGKIVCISTFNDNGNNNNIVLTRYSSEGILDVSFGINGFVYTSLYSDFPMNSFKIQSDDKILVAGVNTEFENQIAVTRYNANGFLDTSFGNNGVVQQFSNFFDISLDLQNDSKILFAGTYLGFSSRDFGIVRLNYDGSYDDSFGDSGMTICNIGITSDNSDSDDVVYGIKYLQDSDIVVSGYTTNIGSGIDTDLALIKLNSGGTLKTSFGNNGKIIDDFGGAEYFVSIATDSNNNIYAGGQSVISAFPDNIYKIAIGKYNINGDLDASFGSQGKIVTTSAIGTFMSISRIVIDENEKIICAGFEYNQNTYKSDMLLLKYDSNGVLDITFDSDGIYKKDFNNSSEILSTLKIKSDGKILCGGSIVIDSALVQFVVDNLSASQFSKSQFSVSPNPFTTSINLTFSLTKNENLTIDLVDANGRVIQNLSEEKAFSSGNNSLNLDLPETLSKGIYFLKINDGFENNTIKIIK